VGNKKNNLCFFALFNAYFPFYLPNNIIYILREENAMRRITKYGAVLPENSRVYRKQLRGVIVRKGEKDKSFHLDASDHIRLMIRADRLRIAARFQNESYMICEAIRRMKPEPTDEGKTLVKAYVNERIRTLWTSCAMDYAEMFTMSFLDSVMPIGEQTRKNANDDATALEDNFISLAQDAFDVYNRYSEMDVKNQSGWQHSAFIYDGELVDQDVPGNINYGYFGKFCNIPASALLMGAGYAQIAAGTYKLEFYQTFFDDPRDTYRLLQGIEIYNQWHNMK